MSGTRLLAVCAVSLLLGLPLGGCDIAPEERLSGTPRGSATQGDLDEQSDDNVIAYFYAGKPVAGLLFACGRGIEIEHSGVTDANGRFVCPRTNTVSFYVGVKGEKTIKLGQIELGIFGGAATPGKRTAVVITPATLYGTNVSGSQKEIINIFNLLYSLDVKGPADRKQQVIDLTSAMQAAAIVEPAFLDLIAGSSTTTRGVAKTPAEFETDLRALVDALPPGIALTLKATTPASPTLGINESIEVADAALLRAHAGLYRSNPTMIDSQPAIDGQPAAVFLGTTEFMVGADGTVSGITVEEVHSASSSYALSVLELDPAARVDSNGALLDFIFAKTTPGELQFSGTLVNDYIWGESRLCQPGSLNVFVPSIFCTASQSDGGFTLLDVGTFDSARDFSGELFVGQPLGSFPDIDLDHLPHNFLPRTYELELKRYKEIEFGDMNNANYDGPGDDKTAFGDLEAMERKLRYTLMPNGDIVSDVDDDCGNLAVVNGRYEDADGSREYLIGRVGSIFKVDLNNPPTPANPEDDRTYLDIYIDILDKAHPDYFGLTIGVGAMYRSSLHEVVLEVSSNAATNEKLRSKSCNPESSAKCNDVIEWFNNIRYAEDVYSVDRSTPSELTAVDIGNYLNVPFFGQVTDNLPVPAPISGTGVQPGDICSYTTPPPPPPPAPTP